MLDKVNGLYHKSQFTYDAEQDVYHCSGGEVLVRIGHTKASSRTREQTLYACHVCTDCAKRSDCTRSLHGRTIKRYPEDEMLQALVNIMEHPRARAVFNQRKALFEPVFSILRQQQGLSRFRRRGLAGVQREFALHVLAYNLGRAVALRCCLFYIAYCWCFVPNAMRYIINRWNDVRVRYLPLSPSSSEGRSASHVV